MAFLVPSFYGTMRSIMKAITQVPKPTDRLDRDFRRLIKRRPNRIQAPPLPGPTRFDPETNIFTRRQGD